MAIQQVRTNLKERLKDGSILMLLAAALAFGVVAAQEEARHDEVAPVAASAGR